MSDQPWNRLSRTGSVMDVDSSSQPRPQVTFALPPQPPPHSQNGDTASRKRRRVLSPESSEETIGERRDFDRNPGPSQDPRWPGPSRPPSVASSYDSSAEAELHRLAIMGPAAAGEYYETWPDTEAEDEPGPGFTQPAAQDPPTPTQAEIPIPVSSGGGGQSGAQAVQVFKKKTISKEDTLMSIDFSQPQDNSASRSTDDALTQKLAAMFDHMRQKQRDDMEEFAASIRAQFVVECADLKNEMTRLRAELVDMRIQYHRMQNGR